MTSRERMLAAFRIEETDHFPMYVRGVRAWDEQWCATRHESYQPVIEAVREYGDYEVGFGLGGGRFLTGHPVEEETTSEDAGDWIIHRTVIHTPAGELTATRKTSTRGLPGLQIEFPVKSLEDLEKVLSVPYEPVRPDPSRFFELDEEIGDDGIVMCAIPVPIYTLALLTGSDLLAVWSLTERETVNRMVDVFLERTLDMLDYAIEAGVGPVYASAGEEYMTPPLAGARDFREFVVKPGLPVRDRLQEAGMLRHIHCHGPISHILEDFVELGANCLHPIEPPPLGDVPFEDAERRIGDRVCLEGNIQIGDLYHDPTDVLVEKVKHTCEVGAPGGGFILCPSASPHTGELTPLTVNNYVAMIETAVEMW
ncbi:MAG: uroporphyrinogen decarboxylase family protein [Armatimonadota bacterium]|nr:uroporphyrinogen decarboxylase family protein [Armatimonadota bacterium]